MPGLSSSPAHGARTDVGRQRAGGPNQDALLTYALPRGGLYAVADGMGGHAAGELASQLALETLQATYVQTKGTPPERLIRAVQAANTAVLNEATGESLGMGTTLIALVVDKGAGLVAHVGDSRAYLLRGRELLQLTDDHSWIAEQVRLGVFSEDEARNHQWRSVVSNALGGEERVRLEIFGFALKAGDRLLLCSDGLSGVMTESELLHLVSRPEAPQIVADRLVEAANDAGGPDNITAVVVDIAQNLSLPRYSLPEHSEQGPEYADVLLSARKGGSMLSYVLLTLGYFTILGSILVERRDIVVGIGLFMMAATALTERWVHQRRLDTQMSRRPAQRSETPAP